MDINIKANVVELRSDPRPDGTWPVNRGLAPGAEFTMTAQTDEERVLIEPLFDEFVALVCEALASARIAAPSGKTLTPGWYEDTARLFREQAAAKREATRNWVASTREAAPAAGLENAASDPDPAEELRPPSEWADAEGITIHDPDGWRGTRDLPAKSYDEPITNAEYRRRRQTSTVGPISALISDEPRP